ncbi:MAG: carboxylesterase family protein [Chromatiaceae bacterium]
MSPDSLHRVSLVASFLAIITLLVATSGCGDKHSTSAMPTPVGFTAQAADRVGDGLGSVATERDAIELGGPDGCDPGTVITLNDEPGGVSQPQVCGLIDTLPGPMPIYTFKGLPYAAPPVAANRWADPQPSQLAEVRGVEYGPKCPQGKAENLDNPDADIQEDCLYLNVWTPKLTRDGTGNLAVMVFIHGGAFISGSGGTAAGDADPPVNLNLYDGSQFLETGHALGQDIVFVTLNYRLGALGFLAGNRLGLAGNFGIKDQTAALQWVRRNIALFGGDPNRVMIFGESAGAQSTALHLSIQANGHQSLFARAVMESGYAVPYMALDEAQAKADVYLAATGCRNASGGELACLRGLSLRKVVANQYATYTKEEVKCAGLQAILPWNPVLDGDFIVADPIASAITKPVMLGSNRNESIPFLADIPANDLVSGSVYAALMDFLFGAAPAAEILATYDILMPGAGKQAQFEQAVTDYLWTCFNREFAAMVRSVVPTNPVFRYHNIHHGSFSIWDEPNAKWPLKPIAQACSTSPAVCHADELPFVFGNPVNMALERQTFTSDEVSLSSALRTYWLQFAVASDPNGAASLPNWPRDQADQLLHPRKYLQLQAPASAIAAQPSAVLATQAVCALWDQQGYEVRSAYNCGSY